MGDVGGQDLTGAVLPSSSAPRSPVLGVPDFSSMLSSFTNSSCGSGSAATGSATTVGPCRVRVTGAGCAGCRVGAAVVFSAAAAAAAAPRVVRLPAHSFAGVLSSAAAAHIDRCPR